MVHPTTNCSIERERKDGGKKRKVSWSRAVAKANTFLSWCGTQACRIRSTGNADSRSNRKKDEKGVATAKASEPTTGILSPRFIRPGLIAGLFLLLVFSLSCPFLPPSLMAHAMSIPSMPADGSAPSPSGVSPWQRGLVFAGLFVISSAFHAAETSITTLYPWKVKEFAKVGRKGRREGGRGGRERGVLWSCLVIYSERLSMQAAAAAAREEEGEARPHTDSTPSQNNDLMAPTGRRRELPLQDSREGYHTSADHHPCSHHGMHDLFRSALHESGDGAVGRTGCGLFDGTSSFPSYLRPSFPPSLLPFLFPLL